MGASKEVTFTLDGAGEQCHISSDAPRTVGGRDWICPQRAKVDPPIQNPHKKELFLHFSCPQRNGLLRVPHRWRDVRPTNVGSGGGSPCPGALHLGSLLVTRGRSRTSEPSSLATLGGPGLKECELHQARFFSIFSLYCGNIWNLYEIPTYGGCFWWPQDWSGTRSCSVARLGGQHKTLRRPQAHVVGGPPADPQNQA